MQRSGASSVSTALDSAHFDAHNIQNPMMELLFHVQIGGIFELFVEEFDMAKITFSCHFAFDLLCDKEGAHGSA